MKTYKELKSYQSELEVELDKLNNPIFQGDYQTQCFFKYSIITVKKELNKINRYLRKFECKFKYSLTWCCIYKKQYDFEKYLKHNEMKLKPYYLHKELIHI